MTVCDYCGYDISRGKNVDVGKSSFHKCCADIIQFQAAFDGDWDSKKKGRNQIQ